MISFCEHNKRKVSLITLTAILVQVFFPTGAFALTGGPSQVEYENFEPAGASEMVNLSTGDFIYNIPLLDVDGYPINISYHGGVGMEQEASWVGLGWSLNPGAISRGLRGFPDDFNGGNDKIKEDINILENRTYGFKIGGGMEVVGFDPATIGASTHLGVVYNNYKGLGLEIELGVTGSISAGNLSASGNLGVNISSQDGTDFTMAGGLGVQASMAYQGFGVGGSMGINRSQNYNSRRGLVADIVSGSAGASVSVYGASYGKTTGSAINLIPNTAYLPNLQYSTEFSGQTGEFKTGGEFFWCNAHGSLRGYIFKQGLSTNSISKNAYGYLNLENADYGSAMDFNRDNDGVYYQENPKLPFATLTYDVFNANAQGLNELFRPYRNDFGSVFDNTTTGGGTANDVGIEANYGSYGEIGANEYGVTSNSTSGIWAGGNIAYNAGVRFTGDNQITNVNGAKTYEHSYFKALDELAIEDPAFYNSIKGDELASFHLLKVNGTSMGFLENKITSQNGSSSVNYTGQIKNNRAPRNSNMSFLNVSEASVFGLDKDIISYKANQFDVTANGDLDKSSANNTIINRNFGLTETGHHISEVTVLKEDGSRYIYGLPVYNKLQKEAIFNCENNSVNVSQGTVSYAAGTDNSTNNAKGKDHFYLGRTLPAYAHSYLLTALVSKDYVDVAGDGLTNDDFGDYTKFNYNRSSSSFQWRSPVSASPNTAIYNQASYSESKDDKAVYVYGEKEQWYPHSIETKNYIAKFITNDRLDGYGVSENGAIASTAGSNSTKLLEKIILYSKKDLNTPIKTVNFVYDYSLCYNTPNSNAPQQDPSNPNSKKGKLTLKKIFYTYGNSDKGVFSPYKFIYADTNHDGTTDAAANPDYNRMSMDRWGIYKPNSGASSFTGLNNDNFPYTNQNDPALANVYSAAWNLSSIVTPAGSKIDVSYESDDYSYIQDQIPAQMLNMVGFANSSAGDLNSPSTYGSLLYDNYSPYTPRNYMMVDLSRLNGGGIKANSYSEANSIFQNKMLASNEKIYFKVFVQIASGSSTQEYVPGYADFERGSSYVSNDPTTQITSGGSVIFTKAYIKLKEVDIEDPKNYPNDNCNPISKAGWQIARLEHPALAYPGSEPGNSGIQALAGLGSAITEAFTFKEKNNRLRKKGYSASINPGMSFVRLTIPTKTKIGGGHRVSKIVINDNWSGMVPTEASTSYGQTYDYSLPNTSGYLSSGVSAYEPLAGGDEISLRKPIEYSVARIAAPDDAHFFEEPKGEAFYPQPTVIYSKITVKNLERRDGNNNLITGNIGRTEYAYFTAKDFPISSDYDGLQSYPHNPKPDGSLFDNYQESSLHLSQGFILRLNNMHGKLKSVLSFQEGNSSAISGVEYTYKTNTNGNSLNNEVSSISEDGTIVSNFMLGQQVEAVGDFRRSNTITFGTTDNYNLNVSPLPIPCCPIPIPIPSYFSGSNTEVRDFYSATLNKVVTQQGILVKVKSISDFASSETENLLWDSRTGDVVLSKTTTNYLDYNYNYSTPAHWINKGMGGAFQNIGLGFRNSVVLSTGLISASASLLKPGDEVELIGTNASNEYKGMYSNRLWISKNGSGNSVLIDRSGKLCNTSGAPNTVNVFGISGATEYVLKVIRSGFRNILDEEAEEIAYSANPLVPGNGIDMVHNILDASAVEFSEEWQKYCSNFTGINSCVTFNNTFSTNPYILNTAGNWNVKRAYGYLGKRLKNDQSNGNFDIRKDGTFETYKPFYTYSGGVWKTVYDPTRSDYVSAKPFDNWILNSEITKISPHGNVLEGKDAINRYSSSLYGYNYSYKTASAVNTQYRHIAADNFEDYFYNNPCYENHFSFKRYRNLLSTNGEAHTGRYSIVVNSENVESQPRNTGYITDSDCETSFGSNNVILPHPPLNTISCACISDFSPLSKSSNSQTYVLSVWIKEANLNQNADYTYGSVQILYNSVSIGTLKKKSGIINGWQKFDYEFTVPPNATGQLDFKLQNLGFGNVYFDDFRIQPFNSTMTTYVYDPLSLRLWAELDERNFATIYEYDNEGVLVRVKKETEKGMMTIKETRNSLKKQSQ